MNAEIITVGAGLLLGNTANASGQFLSHELAAFGIEVTHLSTVGDAPSSLREALTHALGRSELVVLAGDAKEEGSAQALGVLSEVLSLPLELHEESYERIQEYYRNTCREMPADADRQARLPRGATVFPNDHGTAPGCVVSRYGQQIFLLPGEPRELMPMFSDYVAPYLSNCAGGTIVSRTVGVFGLSETVLTERLADLMSEANPNVALYAKDGEAILRVTAHAANRADALALCAPAVDEICRRLGVNVYGVDVGSLQKAVVALLLDKQLKIATAESCTAGLLSGRLTEVAGVSAVFECGIAAYSKEIKRNILGVPEDILEKYGAVSPETARAMAVGARRVGNANLGVGITGVAGPDPSEGKPVGTVYVALADEKRVWVKKIDTKEGTIDREYVRYLATSYALDLVRRYLEALPTVMAGGETLAVPPSPPAAAIPEADVAPKKRHLLRSVFPWKGDSRSDVIRKSAILAVFLLLIAAAGMILYMYVFQPLDNQRLYSQLELLYNVNNPSVIESDLEGAPDGMLSQFNALYMRNSDVRGWLRIEGTNINYPVMRGTDSGFYRTHNFDKQPTMYGTPYFDPEAALVSSESVNRTLVIYGNNVGGGQMFSDLTSYYNNLEFLQEHPVIEMNTLYHNAKWKIFSVMAASSPEDGGFDYTCNVFSDETDFLSFAGELRIRSLYTYPDGVVDVQEGDSLLLLSTDFEDVAGFNGARLVIAARQMREGENEDVDLGGVVLNSSAVMPDGWKGSPTQSVSRTSRPSGSAITGGSTGETESSSSTQDLTSTTPTDSTTEESTRRPSTTPTSPATTTTTTTGETSGTSGTTATTTTTMDDTVGPTTQPDPNPPTSSTSGPTTTTNTPPPPSDNTPPILAGSRLESEYLENCKVRNLRTGEKIEPETKEELQYLLAQLVKSELGTASTFGTPGTPGYMAAQKAQAIASYTYILYYNRAYHGDFYPCYLPALDLSNPTDKQIYDAVGEVVGIKILSGSSPICAMYFSSSPGVTADNKYVYGGALPYGSVISEYDDEAHVGDSDWETVLTYSQADILERVEDYLADPDEGYFPEASIEGDFAILSYDPYGKFALETNITYLDKNGYTRCLSGYQFRAALGLRSQAIQVLSVRDGTVTLQTQGWGHCVGMSQWGAVGYAQEEGWDYRKILSHYYSITTSSAHRLVAPVWG